MDKNVSSVDLEELLKAREELNKEIGVETDPNMYSDYNPDRKNEEKTETTLIEDEDLVTSENSDTDVSGLETVNSSEEKNGLDLEDSKSETQSEEPMFEDGYSEEPKKEEVDSHEKSLASGNLDKYDAFSAFEVKENVHEKPVEQFNIDKVEDSSERTTNLEKLENELMTSLAEEKNNDSILSETSESKFAPIENIEDLELMLDKLLDELDEEESTEDQEKLEVNEESTLKENSSEINETSQTATEEDSQKVEDESSDLANSYLTSLDIEPKFEEVKTEESEDEKLEESNESQDETHDLSETNDLATDYLNEVSGTQEQTEDDEIKEDESTEKTDRLDLFMKGNLGSSETIAEEKSEEDSNSSEKFENTIEENSILELDESIKENSEPKEENEFIADEIEESVKQIDESEVEQSEKLEENLEDVKIEDSETEEDAKLEEENVISEEISEDSETEDDIQTEDKVNVEEKIENKEPEKEKQESISLDSYDASKASTSPFKKAMFENSLSDNETEIITDYSQLREILQRELKESEAASQEKIEEDDGIRFEIIEDFKFLDEIATDEFKNSDKFSYIMGKNEKGEMIYGNFKEHFNLGVFGKNEDVINSFLNSMVLSLCLKNSTSEVNFIMLDSNINSLFDVYNKSSYLYFNRIAKTNKEILDTLIEVTKELDIRYEKLAEDGMSNADQFNDMAKETGTSPMTNLVLVFNNYTDASQATYVDKINACLYQILKYGRLVGIYAVVTAMLPITTNQVNYNLSSRLSFKSDNESKYNVGAEGTRKLPDENDAIYFNITKNTSEHIKTATVTDTELDLIIKELEDEN